VPGILPDYNHSKLVVYQVPNLKVPYHYANLVRFNVFRMVWSSYVLPKKCDLGHPARLRICRSRPCLCLRALCSLIIITMEGCKEGCMRDKRLRYFPPTPADRGDDGAGSERGGDVAYRGPRRH
jgi:hypothetical protein